MLVFDEKILKKKLAEWVLNAHLPELLGIEEEKKDELRETFDKLVEEGVLLTEGKRRGLRFMYNPEHKPTKQVDIEKEVEEVISSAEYLCQAEEAIHDILGLEPDYIMAFI